MTYDDLLADQVEPGLPPPADDQPVLKCFRQHGEGDSAGLFICSQRAQNFVNKGPLDAKTYK